MMQTKIEYQPRNYRSRMRAEDLDYFTLVVKETDLCIAVEKGLSKKALKDVADFTAKLVLKVRGAIEKMIAAYPLFLTSLASLEKDYLSVLDEQSEAWGEEKKVLEEMLQAGKMAKVGPMAAVAGTIAEYVLNGLEERYGFSNIIVENGGDLFLKTDKQRKIVIYAGQSVLSEKVGVLVGESGIVKKIALCTSAGTVGHSLSFGKADAVLVLGSKGSVADAFATKFGNEMRSINDLKKLLKKAKNNKDILGTVVVINDKIGVVGEVQLVLI